MRNHTCRRSCLRRCLSSISVLIARRSVKNSAALDFLSRKNTAAPVPDPGLVLERVASHPPELALPQLLGLRVRQARWSTMCVHLRVRVRACACVCVCVCVVCVQGEGQTSRASSAKASFAGGLLSITSRSPAEAAATRASLRRGVRVLHEGPRASAERNGGARRARVLKGPFMVLDVSAEK